MKTRPKPFRLGIVGAGMITRGSHLPAALSSPHVHVAALVDPVTERATEIADDFGLSVRIAPDVEEVLGEVDGVLIATPNHTHAAIAVRCAHAGVHTLVEKPLATSSAEARAIVEAAREAGTVVAVGYVTRFQNTSVLLKRLLDEGAFGRVKRFVHQYGTVGGWAPVSGYNLDASAVGGGVLMVSGTHFLDRMLHYWGTPDEVSLETDAESGPEANCLAHFTYRNGSEPVFGAALYSKTTHLTGGLIIDCDRGMVRVLESGSGIEWFPESSPHLGHVIRHRGKPPFPEGADAFRLQLEDFVDSARSRRPPMITGEQGAASIELVERLYAARRPMDTDWYRVCGGDADDLRGAA